ncbi:hypothetical protein ACNKHR_21380 [Shigella flexneri]
MEKPAPAPSRSKGATTTCAAPVTSESCALDLGSAEAKRGLVLKPASRRRINSTAPQHRGPRFRLPVVPVRVHVRRRCCVSWPITLSLKDTVLKEVPEEWVKAQGLLEVRSESATKISTHSPGYGPPPVCRSCSSAESTVCCDRMYRSLFLMACWSTRSP